MQRFFRYIFTRVAPLSLLILPFLASAHEVYVLDSATVSLDVSNPSPNPFSAIATHTPQFYLWAFIGIVTVSGVFLISISRKLETLFSPTLFALKPYAPLLARLTLGSSLLSSAYHTALFGPELSLLHLAPHHFAILQTALYIAGFLILFGAYARAGACLFMALYAWSFVVFGSYMVTYIDYLGGIIPILIFGSGAWSIDSYRGANILRKIRLRKLFKKLEPFSFALLRISFGISLLFASLYAKFWHSSLALDTVIRYHLTDFFPFDPLFIVLGACIIEILIGLFFIFGIEIRFTSLFFLFFLTLSLLYFGEAVWPHLILIGLNLTLFVHGYDRYSLEGRFFKKGKREPIF